MFNDNYTHAYIQSGAIEQFISTRKSGCQKAKFSLSCDNIYSHSTKLCLIMEFVIIGTAIRTHDY